MNRHASFVFAAFCLAAIAAPPAYAQTTGSISGRVTNGTTEIVNGVAPGAGIQGVGLLVYTSTDQFVQGLGGAGTNASGDFTITGLQPGTYRIATNNGFPNSPGYIDQLYRSDGSIECAGCPPSSNGGTAIVVPSSGSMPAGINFALLRGTARITGRVTDRVTLAGLAGINVNVSRRSGGSVSAAFFGQSDANGNFAQSS